MAKLSVVKTPKPKRKKTPPNNRVLLFDWADDLAA